MHILKGKYKGKKITFPSKDILRPTKNSVREGVFNALQFQVPDSCFLDACCGVGSMGIEALSRGASHVDFVDTDTQHLKPNLCSIANNYTVIESQIEAFLGSKMHRQVLYDIIFLDPPWDEHMIYVQSLKAIFESDILSPNGIVLCEYNRKSNPFKELSLEPRKRYSYGKTCILTVQKEGWKNG